jgi:TRAP-type transport system periplasmic protein
VRASRTAAFSIAAFLATVVVEAQSIKIGTLAPTGSPWEQALRRLAAEWDRVSGGSVSMRVYPGGVAGDEDDMLRKVRIGQLNAVALSGPGLASIVPSMLAIQVPQLVSDDRELDYLMGRMTAYFERQFEDKGFRLLAWTRAGWAYIFARDPVVWPDDLKRQKLWVWQGSGDEARAWRTLGFQPVQLGSADIMMQLQSGGIDAFITSPLIVAANQYFAVANDMTELRWAPFVGGLLVSARVWDGIAPDVRARLERAAVEVTDSYRREFLGADAEAIAVMKKHGLMLHDPPPAARQAWAEFVKKGADVFLAGQSELSVYETAVRHLQELRRSGR